MALTKDERQKLDETHDCIIRLETVLLGTDGDNGLVGDVKLLAKSHFKLKKNFWILVAFLAGSGFLGCSLCALLTG